jgi:hypothetical protein
VRSGPVRDAAGSLGPADPDADEPVLAAPETSADDPPRTDPEPERDAQLPSVDALTEGQGQANLGTRSAPPNAPPAPPETAPPGWSAFTPVIPPDPLPFDDPPSSGGWEHVSVRQGDDDAWLRTLRQPAAEDLWTGRTARSRSEPPASGVAGLAEQPERAENRADESQDHADPDLDLDGGDDRHANGQTNGDDARDARDDDRNDVRDDRDDRDDRKEDRNDELNEDRHDSQDADPNADDDAGLDAGLDVEGDVGADDGVPVETDSVDDESLITGSTSSTEPESADALELTGDPDRPQPGRRAGRTLDEDSRAAASENRRAFGRAPAERLSQALSRGDDGTADEQGDVARGERWADLVEGAGGRTPTDHPDEVADAPPGEDDEEPVRGTLAPVLRRSTQRATHPTGSTPVIRPPVPLSRPGDGPDAAAPPRDRPVSWEEALAVDVVPGKGGRRRGRRVAKARHVSGGPGEYRPRASRDRSLTLLVVGMLLVLVVLLGVAAWAFWPRVFGERSLPAPAPSTSTSAPAA